MKKKRNDCKSSDDFIINDFIIKLLICEPAILAFTIERFNTRGKCSPYGKGLDQLSAKQTTGKALVVSAGIPVSHCGPDSSSTVRFLFNTGQRRTDCSFITSVLMACKLTVFLLINIKT